MRIFNLSLSTGTFPDKLKLAKVSPILKSWKYWKLKLKINENVENDLVINYRPISSSMFLKNPRTHNF